MLIVLEIAPEMNGWAAAIIRTWACQSMDLLPCLPHGVAQSNTAKCSSFSRGPLDTPISEDYVICLIDAFGRKADVC